MSEFLGKSIGRYHILEQLGQGGMATVHKAYDTRLEREVAIKIIRKEAFPPEQLDKVLKRFEREAKALAKLDHPNIIKVHDYGEYNGSPYLVMYYVQAGTLKEKIGKPIPYQEAAQLLFAISDALSYAHQQGVYHRDVKPSNILITQTGQPILSDFGIAKLLESEDAQTLTGTGLGVGTPEYMAPEQGLGKNIDGRADIYALGVVFYEMITGHKPYTADTPMAVIIKQINDPLPRPKETIPTLPDDIEKVLLKALAKNPDDRYQNMREFGKALGSLVELYLLKNKNQEHIESQSFPKPMTDSTQKNAEIEETRDNLIASAQPVYNATKKKYIWRKWVGIGILLMAIVVGSFFIVHNALKRSSEKKATVQNTQEAISTQTSQINMPYETEIKETKEAQAIIIAKAATASAWISTPEGTITPTPGIGSTQVHEVDGMVQVYVPAGEFEMGSTDGYNDEQPVHTVYLDAYWMDETEVTNGMYEKCVEEGGCTEPRENKSYARDVYYGNSQYDDYPVIYVDWYQAEMYCEWAGRELPTEAQWEKTARGTNGRTYPWREGLSRNLANYGFSVGDTTELGSYEEGKSPYGAYDMAGNVWEWVADWYEMDYYSTTSASNNNPENTEESESKVLRGGSWSSSENNLRTAYRFMRFPGYTYSDIGFRCLTSEN